MARISAKAGGKTPYSAQTIGIVGSSSGVGVTHFSVMTASYLSAVLGKKTVLAERNSSGDFARIEEILAERAVLRKKEKPFKALEISFIKEAGPDSLSGCISGEYEAVVIDFGNDLDAVRTEFLLCQRKFFVGSFSEWKFSAFLSVMEHLRRPDGTWEWFVSSGNRELAKEMRRYPGTIVRYIPRTEDAFSLTGETMAFFGEFLEY